MVIVGQARSIEAGAKLNEGLAEMIEEQREGAPRRAADLRKIKKDLLWLMILVATVAFTLGLLIGRGVIQ